MEDIDTANKQNKPFSQPYQDQKNKDEIFCVVDSNSASRSFENAEFEKLKKIYIKRSNSRDISMRIHPEGKIHAKRVPTYSELMTRLESNRDNLLMVNRDYLKKFLHDARSGRTVLKGQKKKIGIKRLQKYLQDMKKVDAYFRKDFADITPAEMDDFMFHLEEGMIKTKTGKPYASETQAGIKKVVRKFWKWFKGDNEFFPDHVKYIDTTSVVPAFNYVKKDRVDAMLGLISSNRPHNIVRNRALIAFLFDSGVRAEELLNIRLKHLDLDNGYFKVLIEFSKTKPRTIFIPLYTDIIQSWLGSHPLQHDKEAQLFPLTYEQLRKIVHRAGKSVGITLKPHDLRHSSATYWARELNYFDHCYRYGWALSSKMPQRYIEREGLYSESARKVIETNSLSEVKEENAKLKRDLSMFKEKFEQIFGEDLKEAKRIIQLVQQAN